MNITLQMLDDNTLSANSNPRVLIIGRRKRGKTFLCRKLLRIVEGPGSVPVVVTRCPDKKAWEKHDEVLSVKESINENDVPLDRCIVFDRYFHDNDEEWASDEVLLRTLKSGQRSVFVTITKCSGIHPWVLAKFDLVFIFRDFVHLNICNTFDTIFYNILRSRDVFEYMYLSLDRFESLVVDFRVTSAIPTDKLFWYKAKTQSHEDLLAQALSRDTESEEK